MKIEHKEVDKKRGIVQITTSDERWYQIGKIFVPSVTWIGSFYPKGIQFYKWLADKGWSEAEAIKREAGDKGSKVHKAAEDILMGKPVRHDALYMNHTTGKEEELTVSEYEAVVSFSNWLKQANPEILGKEYTIFDEKIGYAGTVDLRVRMNGEIWIIDLKTSQTIWMSHRIQVSAYKHADKDVEKTAILQIGYQRNKNKFKFTEVEDEFDLFLAARKIWARETSMVVPSQKDFPIEVSWKHTKEEKKPADEPKAAKPKRKIKVRRKIKRIKPKTDESKID